MNINDRVMMIIPKELCFPEILPIFPNNYHGEKGTIVGFTQKKSIYGNQEKILIQFDKVKRGRAISICNSFIKIID